MGWFEVLKEIYSERCNRLCLLIKHNQQRNYKPNKRSHPRKKAIDYALKIISKSEFSRVEYHNSCGYVVQTGAFVDLSKIFIHFETVRPNKVAGRVRKVRK